MPSNERIALLAKQKAAKLDIEWIAPPTISVLGDRYVVQFKNGLRVYLSREEIDAVAQEPEQELKQEHDHANCNFCNQKIAQAFEFGIKTAQLKQAHRHDADTCIECNKIWNEGHGNVAPEHCSGENCAICHDRYCGAREIGFEEGKASLKPFDRDEFYQALFRHMTENTKWTQRTLADAVADHFAAPERKPFHINTEMRSYFREAYNARARRNGVPELDASYLWNAFHDMEKVYADEAQPMEAEPKPVTCTAKQAREIYDRCQVQIGEFEGFTAFSPAMLTQAIPDVLGSMPVEAKRKLITEADVRNIANIVDRNFRTGMDRNAVTADAFNEYFASQPAPADAERCSECKHVEGTWGKDTTLCGNGSCRCRNTFHRERGAV